jgi:proliferating cell nuclear antigen
MFLRTIQASSFRNIFEVLKDIINDVNIYFDSKGVHIDTLDTARVSLVHVFLAAENFEEYSCPSEIIAGINISNTYKLLKSITGSDTFSMAINDSEYMDIMIRNEEKKSSTKFRLKLLEIDEEILEVPDIPMDTITTVPSIDFQRICRDMGNLSTEIHIHRDLNHLQLSCTGDFANQTTSLDCPDTANKPTGNIYSLKYINLFTKATGMCSNVQLFQSSEDLDMPIIVRYSVANLGEMKFYLAPKTTV